MPEALKNHWQEYLIEAWGLGTFIVSARVFGVILFHSDFRNVTLLTNAMVTRLETDSTGRNISAVRVKRNEQELFRRMWLSFPAAR